MNSHVGIPKCILKEFANKNTVCVFNLEKKKEYIQSIDTAGTIHNYYNLETEQILSDKVESNFGALIMKLKNLNSYKEKTEEIYNNLGTIESFIVYQFQRSEKSLESYNKNSLLALFFRPLTHSEYLQIIDKIEPKKINILSMMKQPMSIRIALNKSDEDFITNSIGFYFSEDKETNLIDCVFIPISSREVIVIRPSDELSKVTTYYYANDERANIMNRLCIIFEKSCGNGYIFSKQFIGKKYGLVDKL